MTIDAVITVDQFVYLQYIYTCVYIFMYITCGIVVVAGQKSFKVTRGQSVKEYKITILCVKVKGHLRPSKEVKGLPL